MLFRIIVGLVLSAVIGLVGYWRGSLSRSGVLGAILTGTPIFAFGGFVWGLLLVAFFTSSSVLSHYRARFKSTLADKFQKGSQRDLGQALANGGWAAILAVAVGFTREPVLFILFVGALATVTADTWATEIGVLSRRAPRLITSGRIAPVGTSGAITPLGTITALVGSLFIGLIAAVSVQSLRPFFPVPDLIMFNTDDLGLAEKMFREALVRLPMVAALSGLGGSLFDSLLGATVQATYYCEYDRKETERRIHSCGRATRLVRGWRWLDNDAVNFLASVFGSGVAATLWLVLVPRVL